MIGAIWAMVTRQMSREERVGAERDADHAEHVGERHVERHREGLHQADQQRGDERAGERAEPADHDDDEQDRPEQRGHVGLGHQRRAGDDAGKRREAGAARRTPA